MREGALWIGAVLGVLSIAGAVAVIGLGYSLLIFRSGSMGPEIPTGSLAVARTVEAADLRVGDVVSVDTAAGARVTHRIVQIDDSGSTVSLTLKGDANQAPDDETYAISSTPRVVGSVPVLGYVVARVLSPLGILAVGAIGVVLAVIGLRSDREDRGGSGRRRKTSPARARERRPRARERVALMGAAGIAVMLTGVAVTSAAFTDVATGTSTASSAKYFTCNSAMTANNPANPFFYYKFDGNVQDSSGNGRTGTITGVVNSDPSQACERDTGSAARFNGLAGYVSSPVTSSPAVFTIELWFKAPVLNPGGKLIGYGNARTGASAQYDRHIYMTDAGQLVFGVYPNTVRTIQSPAAYNDNDWHHVVATLSSAGMRLYVDGAEVAADPGTTTAQAIGSGYWRLGYDNLNGWPTKPLTDGWLGSEDEVAVYYAAMSADEVKAHYLAGR